MLTSFLVFALTFGKTYPGVPQAYPTPTCFLVFAVTPGLPQAYLTPTCCLVFALTPGLPQAYPRPSLGLPQVPQAFLRFAPGFP
jgi:hypothetical protein